MRSRDRTAGGERRFLSVGVGGKFGGGGEFGGVHATAGGGGGGGGGDNDNTKSYANDYNGSIRIIHNINNTTNNTSTMTLDDPRPSTTLATKSNPPKALSTATRRARRN